MTKKYTKSAATYAKQYGYGKRTIERYMTAGYPLDDPAALAEILASQRTQPAGAVPKNLAAAKLEREILSCERLRVVTEQARVDLAAAQGRLIAVSDVRASVAKITAGIQATLLSLGSDLAGILVGMDENGIKAAIDARAAEICRQWSDPNHAMYGPG